MCSLARSRRKKDSGRAEAVKDSSTDVNLGELAIELRMSGAGPVELVHLKRW